MLYGLGGLALIAVFWYLFRQISVYIGSAPARGKGIPPDAMRYFNELERLLDPYKSDKDVIECLMAANKELQSQYASYANGTTREYPNALFGPDSYGKNREEVWAIWVLLNYQRCSVINNMRDRLLERMAELAKDKEARPPVLFEDCREWNHYLVVQQSEERDRLLRQRITECVARSGYKRILPGISIDAIINMLFDRRYDYDLSDIDDVTDHKVRAVLKSIAEKM
jgi:hypothetical protein